MGWSAAGGHCGPGDGGRGPRAPPGRGPRPHRPSAAAAERCAPAASRDPGSRLSGDGRGNGSAAPSARTPGAPAMPELPAGRPRTMTANGLTTSSYGLRERRTGMCTVGGVLQDTHPQRRLDAGGDHAGLQPRHLEGMRTQQLEARAPAAAATGERLLPDAARARRPRGDRQARTIGRCSRPREPDGAGSAWRPASGVSDPLHSTELRLVGVTRLAPRPCHRRRRRQTTADDGAVAVEAVGGETSRRHRRRRRRAASGLRYCFRRSTGPTAPTTTPTATPPATLSTATPQATPTPMQTAIQAPLLMSTT